MRNNRILSIHADRCVHFPLNSMSVCLQNRFASLCKISAIDICHLFHNIEMYLIVRARDSVKKRGQKLTCRKCVCTRVVGNFMLFEISRT